MNEIETYLERGWSLIPLREGDKRPATDWKKYQKEHATSEEVVKWYEEMGKINIGIVTGKTSGITVIDVDGELGQQSVKGLALPPTWIVKTPRGWHYYYQYREDYEQGAGRLPGVDIRNDGGYVVAPPSQVGGKKYIDMDITDELAQLPPYETFFESKKRESVVKEQDVNWVTKALEGVGSGQRNDTAARLAGHYLAKNIREDEAFEYLKSFANNCNPTMATQEVAAVVRSVYRYAGEIAKADLSRDEPEFEARAYTFRYRWPQYGITVTVDQLSTERSGLWCELEIEMDYPGMTLEHGPSRFNLLAPASRASLIKALATRLDLDWGSIIEYICRHAVKFHREGEPSTNILEYVSDGVDPWVIPPLVLDDDPTIIFGDGGAGKSTLALATLISAQTGVDILGITPSKKLKGLYLDWEDSKSTFKDRTVRILNGADIGLDIDIRHSRCELPIKDIAGQIRKEIVDQEIDFVIIDSVGVACGGDPSSPEVALNFFQVVRTFRTAVLGIAHQAKNMEKQRMPFGSVFWQNMARSTVEAQGTRNEVTGDIYVTLWHRKTNKGMLLLPINYRIRYGEENITFDRVTQDQMPTKESDRFTCADAISDALAEWDLDVSEISEATGYGSATVRKTLNRGDEFIVVNKPKPGEKSTWGLKSRGVTPFKQKEGDTRGATEASQSDQSLIDKDF